MDNTPAMDRTALIGYSLIGSLGCAVMVAAALLDIPDEYGAGLAFGTFLIFLARLMADPARVSVPVTWNRKAATRVFVALGLYLVSYLLCCG
jgi:hypothetical protein